MILNRFQKVYAYSLCVYVLAAADVSWLSRFPISIICICISIMSFTKMVSTKIIPVTPKIFILSCLLFIYLLLSIIVWGTTILGGLAKFFALLSIILLPLNEKRYFLNAITNCFVIILLISIPAWILYLIGIPLPHSGIIYHSNGFHEFYDYYFFRVSAKGLSIFPRFSSIFLEAGQLATPCAFLFFLNGANFSRKNLVLLTAIGLSFSLIAYGLVLFSFVSFRFLSTSKYRLLKVLSSATIVLGISLYFSHNESSDDPMTTMIVSRLEFDEEKGISGNNRLSSEFQIRYDSFANSEDKYLGIHNKLIKGYDWTYNSSGIMKFIVHHGFLGIIVFGAFIFMLFWNNRCLGSFVWLVSLIVAFVVRDLLQTPLWCGIAIVGFYILKMNTNMKSGQRNDYKNVRLIKLFFLNFRKKGSYNSLFL